MKQELAIGKENLVALVSENGLADVMKPLVREIHLFDTFIAGTTHLKDPSVLAGVKTGDALTLRREENRFDDNAILVLNAEGKKLGYIPEKDNIIFARLMDAGKLLSGKVADVEEFGKFTKIRIGIYLVDF